MAERRWGMMTDGRGGRPTERREPAFERPRPRGSDLDIRLSAEDRPGSVRPSGRDRGARQEPHFTPSIQPGLDPIAANRPRPRPEPAPADLDAGDEQGGRPAGRSRDTGRATPS